jgi:PAS domain S-box-containing protein
MTEGRDASARRIGDNLQASRFRSASLSPASSIKRRPPLTILFFLVLAVPLLAFSVLHLEGPRIRGEALANLAAIGRLKSDQIETWLSERHDDAAVLMLRHDLVNDAQLWFEHRDAGARERIDQCLATLRRAYRNQEVELLDARTLRADLPNAQRAMLAAAFASGKVRNSGLYRDLAGTIWLDFVVPLFKYTASGPKALGAVLLHTRASAYLFPLIQTWPTASRSAETLLVRRDGDTVQFLNDLRHRQGSSLTLRLPLSSLELPAAVAVRENRIQTLQGRDYRGVPVLAAVRPVRGTDWLLVAKVDLNEVQRPLYQLVLWVALVALVAIVAVGFILRRLWRQQAQSHQLELIAQTAEKDRLLNLFYDLPFMGMGIVEPKSRRWLHVNDRMCEILGYSREELLGLSSCEQLTHPDDLGHEMAELERLLAGEIEGYQMEKRFHRKDDGFIDVALSVKCVRRADGKVEYLVKTVRDITDRKKLAAAMQDQQRTRHLLESIADTSTDSIFVKDLAGNYLFYNRAAASGVNRSVAEVLGRNDLALYPPEQAAHIMAVDREVMDGDEPVTFEEKLSMVEGERIFLTTKGPLCDTEGKVIGLYGIARDITERKQVEKALAASSARLSGVIESAMDAIISVDADQRVLLFNPAAERIFGCTRAEALGQSLERFIPARFQKGHARHVQNFSATGATSRNLGAQSELYAVRSDGSEFPIEASISQVELGEERLFTVILRDIGARKQAERALHEREEDLNRAQSVGHIGSWRLDVRCNELIWSAENHRIFGIAEGAALTYETFLGCVHPEDRGPVDQAWQAGLRGEPYDIQHRLLVDGEVKWVRERAELEFDAEGNLLGGFGITQDITDIKTAEQALRDSEARLQLATEIGRSGTWDWNVHSGEVIWSRGHYEILGYRVGEVEPGYQAWVERVHRDDRARVESEIQRSMRERVDYVVEFRVVWPDTSIRWMSARGRYEYDPDGACRRMIGVMADITTFKQAELALREADQRKDEFLAMLAHELRNPLAPIRNAAHVLGRLDLAEPRLRWAQDIIERQVSHLAHLVDELLDVSRIVQGKIVLKKTRIELPDLIRQACESVQPIMSAKGHHFNVQMPVTPVLLEGDLVRLVQILQNLLNNAAKYTPDCGCIELLGHLLESEIEIEVRDNGMGITADLLPVVFDLFRQGNRTLDRSQGGLGIGLTLVRQLVRLHGGQVSASSRGPGQGASFIVRLPLAAAAEPALVVLDAGRGEALPGRSLRVLVVEDDPVVAESMVVFLELEGYRVRSAAAAEAALELIDEFQPQVALIDIGLPGQDGYALAARIRQRADCANLILLAVSGYGHAEAVQRSQQAGFDQHLVKPVEPDRLCALLAEIAASDKLLA